MRGRHVRREPELRLQRVRLRNARDMQKDHVCVCQAHVIPKFVVFKFVLMIVLMY